MFRKSASVFGPRRPWGRPRRSDRQRQSVRSGPAVREVLVANLRWVTLHVTSISILSLADYCTEAARSYSPVREVRASGLGGAPDQACRPRSHVRRRYPWRGLVTCRMSPGSVCMVAHRNTVVCWLTKLALQPTSFKLVGVRRRLKIIFCSIGFSRIPSGSNFADRASVELLTGRFPIRMMVSNVRHRSESCRVQRGIRGSSGMNFSVRSRPCQKSPGASNA